MSIPANSAPPVSVDISSDSAWTSSIGRVNDENVLKVDLPAGLSVVGLGNLPPTTDVTAFGWYENTYRLFTVDVATDTFQGTLLPQYVIAWDGLDYYLAFDPETAAIPTNVGIDAVSLQLINGLYTTLLSFDVSLQLPGGLFAADEDMVAWNGSNWSMYFDGSAHGLPAQLDVDGFDRDPATGTLYFSFDTSGQLGNVYFADEDIMAFDGQSWTMALDGSTALGPEFTTTDLDAFSLRSGILFRNGFESPPPAD